MKNRSKLLLKATQMYRLLVALVCLGFLSAGIAQAGPTADFQALLAATKDMQGEFTQTIVSEKGIVSQSSSGQFWLKQPGKFRWDYQQPYVQKIISNGVKVWIYDEDLEQVTIKKIDSTQNSSPLSIFAGDAELTNSFRVSAMPTESDLAWVKLQPKGEALSFESIDIGFKGKKLQRMTMYDQFGQTTHIVFAGLVKTNKTANAMFEFTPPKGVDVFEE